MLAEIALMAILHQCCVTTDEAVRYQQLAQMEQSRIEAAEEYEEWLTTSYDYYDYYEPSYDYFDTEDGITAAEFMYYGVVDDGGVHYTWYSQRVLPGGGLNELNTNGRHVEGGYVMDGDGYIAVASSDHEIGTVLDTPFGAAKVYDTGCASGTVDVYTDF